MEVGQRSINLRMAAETTHRNRLASSVQYRRAYPFVLCVSVRKRGRGKGEEEKGKN